MKYLFVAVLFWGCTSNLKLQGPRHPQGVYHQGKMIGYGHFKSDKMAMREEIIPIGPQILYATYSADLFLKETVEPDTTGLCNHIYVAVEPTKVKVPKGSVIIQSRGGDNTKGKEIVCLKCFHVTNQIIEYTEPVYILPNMPSFGPHVPATTTKVDTSLLARIVDCKGCDAGWHTKNGFYYKCRPLK